MSAAYESHLVMHGVAFPQEARRYYQRRRNKHSSGDAEWHSRTPRLRAIQRHVASYRPWGWENWCEFIRQLGVVLS